jgi:hypothetical protein
MHFPKEKQGVRQALINSDSLRNPLMTIDGERGTNICCQVFLADRIGIEKIHQELMSTLEDNAYGLFQVKIWLHRFRTGDLAYSNIPPARRPPLTLGPQVEAFLQKLSLASARRIAMHFLTTASTIKEIFQKELGTRKLSRCWVPHFLSDAPKPCLLRQQKKCEGFCRSQKRMLLMASQQATSSGINIPRNPRKWLPIRQQMSFRGRRQAVGAKRL